jgi:extracellular factor (EF) 3-hydroxypalmitic acid methyl ester biosynthesis protein
MSADLLQQVRQVARDLARQLASIQAADAVEPESRYHQVHSIMQHALDQLAQTGCWGSANRIASNELWRIAGTQLATGSLQEHARAKPRGYAGDFEMLEMIDAHDLCLDPLGHALDRFFQQQAAPEAVRDRIHLVTEAMVKTITNRAEMGAHLVSVGSGPALDVARALSHVSPQLRQSVHVTLIDIDPEALENAAARLCELIPTTQLTCTRENLFRLSKRGSGQSLWDQADLISCPGLFDYLDDDHAVAMLTTFWQHLSPQGTLLVFNFAPTNPSRAFMEWIGQWHLIYRDTDAMARLAVRAEMDGADLTIEAGPLGICPYIRATAT